MMKTTNIFAALSMISFLGSVSLSAIAAEPVDTPEIRAAAQKAVTRDDHETVAKFYEDAATQIQAKAKDLQSHASAQVREYEQAVEANIKEARLHHQMALKADENHAASSPQRLSAIGQ